MDITVLLFYHLVTEDERIARCGDSRIWVGCLHLERKTAVTGGHGGGFVLEGPFIRLEKARAKNINFEG